MKAPLGSCGSGHHHVPRAVPVPKLQPPGPVLLPALLSPPHRGHRAAQGTGTAVAGGHPSLSPCPQPPGPRASSPAALPAWLTPRIGATEGEIQALTRSDSSHSRDGDLGCHLAASRRGTAVTARRACNPEQMAAPAPRGAPLLCPTSSWAGGCGSPRSCWVWVAPSPRRCPRATPCLVSARRGPRHRSVRTPAPSHLPGSFLPEVLLGWEMPGSLQLTLMSRGGRRWIPVAAQHRQSSSSGKCLPQPCYRF